MGDPRDRGRLPPDHQPARRQGLIQWTYGGSKTNDEWQIVESGGGYYRIVNRHSGKVLDVSGGGTTDGADVIQWSWSGADNQQFQITSVP